MSENFCPKRFRNCLWVFVEKRGRFLISGSEVTFEEWPSKEIDENVTNQLWDLGVGKTLDGDWSDEWLGYVVIARAFTDDGEEILSGILHSVLTEGSDPWIQIISPSDPDHRYWSMKWSDLCGECVIVPSEQVEQKFGINVCVFCQQFCLSFWNVFKNVSGCSKWFLVVQKRFWLFKNVSGFSKTFLVVQKRVLFFVDDQNEQSFETTFEGIW